jgi:hypothetical protein
MSANGLPIGRSLNRTFRGGVGVTGWRSRQKAAALRAATDDGLEADHGFIGRARLLRRRNRAT